MAVAAVGAWFKSGVANGAGPVTVSFTQAATAGNYVVIGFASSGANTAKTLSASGWTILGPFVVNNSTSSGKMWILWKKCAGGESSVSVSWTGGNMITGWRGREFSGVDAAYSSIFDLSTGSSTALGPFSLTAAARTTTVAGEYLISFLGGRGQSAAPHTWDASAGTETDSGGTGTAGMLFAAEQTIASSGTTVTPSASAITNTQGFPVTLIGWISLQPTAGGITVTVTNPGNQTNTIGDTVSLPISASDSGSLTLTYSATGLPAGLSINTSSGVITGSPTTANVYSVNVTATDTSSNSGSTAFTWTINAAGGTVARKVRVATTATVAARKDRLAGTATAGDRKIRVGGTAT